MFEDGPPATWSETELEKEFVAWVQESWNHPSIAWWDSANENTLDSVGRVVGRVRQLDPTRQWENGGWQTPLFLDDPVEHHPYFFAGFPFRPIQRLDEDTGLPPTFPGVDPSHPWVANEYAFLWIGPDGLPTPATEAIYQNIVGPKPFDPAEVREAHAYLVAGLTEFLRARRGYAGVQHFVYLSHASEEGYITSDDFLDHRDLVLEPRWREYARNAFAQIAVYVDSWREAYPPDEDAEVPLVLMNDTNEAEPVSVRLLAVLPDGTVAATSATESFLLNPVSSTSVALTLRAPAAERWVLYAEIQPEGRKTVWSRRKIGYEHEGIAIPDPPFR